MRTNITTIRSILIFLLILAFVSSCSILKNPYATSDGDGVPYRKDKCPDTPAGVVVDENGCPLDLDYDGVPDYKDDCPDQAGDPKFNGCPDNDGDGIPDKDDDCPFVAGLAKFKGCPDTDEDRVQDNKDKCPDTPKGCPVDATGCPLDSDGDGIIDCEDKCPSEMGTKNNSGCPEWMEVGAQLPDQINGPDDEKKITEQKVTKPSDLINQNQEIKLRSATAGIAHPKKLRSQEEEILRVFVKINASPIQIRSTIRKSESEEYQVEVNRDTTSIFIISNIEVYDSLIIRPLYSDSDFSLTPVNTELKQKLDLINGNQWLWKVRAESKDPHIAKITIEMEGITPKGLKLLAIRHIPIEIFILSPNPNPDTIWDKISKWILEKIEYIISAFIAAYIGYLIKRIFEKREKNK